MDGESTVQFEASQSSAGERGGAAAALRPQGQRQSSATVDRHLRRTACGSHQLSVQCTANYGIKRKVWTHWEAVSRWLRSRRPALCCKPHIDTTTASSH